MNIAVLWSRLENPERQLSIYENLTLDKSMTSTQGGKGSDI